MSLFGYTNPDILSRHQNEISSICMWAYAGEICFPPSASKNFPRIIPHTVPKGRGHGFNDSIYL